MTRKFLCIVSLLFLCSIPFWGQSLGTLYDTPRVYGGRSIPHFAIKNNILLDATLSFNLALEFRVSNRHTVELGGSYNPWTFDNNKKFKHWMVQPEFRYWLCEPFYGHFFGIHPTYAHYNVGNINLGSLKDHRYEGDLYGGGFSYGYNWFLSPRWSLEATIGFGYLYLDYDRFECSRCGEMDKKRDRHYVGPTRAGISLIYILK
ncbi:MAG: DUF3575 domain-containing protein [Bacteroides sp.]|nr:DUF3575 domain-containing protein [Bacteroides sp.]